MRAYSNLAKILSQSVKPFPLNLANRHTHIQFLDKTLPMPRSLGAVARVKGIDADIMMGYCFVYM